MTSDQVHGVFYLNEACKLKCGLTLVQLLILIVLFAPERAGERT